MAREPLHSFSLVTCLAFAEWLHRHRGERQVAKEQAEAVNALATEHGFAFYIEWGNILRGAELAAQGQAEEGIALIRQGQAAYHATGAEITRPFFLALLAKAQEQAGQAKEGLATVAEAVTIANQTEERAYEAELYRLKGELALQSQAGGQQSKIEEEAEACFHKALNIARHQQAKSWELRAATSHARLWQRHGKITKAHDLLLEIYNWFTEGFDTKDLQDAKALLEELA